MKSLSLSAIRSRSWVSRRVSSVLDSVAERIGKNGRTEAEVPAIPAGAGIERSTVFERGIEALLRTRDDFDALFRRCVPARVWLERQLFAGHSSNDEWTVPGYCEVCAQPTELLLDFKYSDGRTPNFRERLVCQGCALSNRQRFMFAFVSDLLKARRGAGRAYVYELVTPFYAAASKHWPAAAVIGSEYLGHEYRSGDTVKGLMHQDALALSFEDGAFDVIVANDVYEHVPDDTAAFREAARVLTDDGWLVLSVPFWPNNVETRQRARLDEGSLKHIEEPAYHGNPVDPKGSLVFFDYGWDLFDRLKRSGFRDAYAIAYYSPTCGYIGDGMQVVFVAEK